MKIVGSTELKTHDLGDSLQFVITQSVGWTEVAFEVILIGGFSFYAWRQSSAILTIFVVLAIVGVLVNRIQGRETLLRVSESGIIARRHSAGWSWKENTIPVGEINSMGWSAGGEGDDGGVYVMRGPSQFWVLPGASEEHGRIVISAIEDRFPAFPLLIARLLQFSSAMTAALLRSTFRNVRRTVCKLVRGGSPAMRTLGKFLTKCPFADDTPATPKVRHIVF